MRGEELVHSIHSVCGAFCNDTHLFHVVDRDEGVVDGHNLNIWLVCGRTHHQTLRKTHHELSAMSLQSHQLITMSESEFKHHDVF